MQSITFLLKPHFSLMAFTAAADALVTTNLVAGSVHYQLRTVSLEQKTVISDLGIRIETDATLSGGLNNERSPLCDVAVICGGYRCDRDANKELEQYLQRCAEQGKLLVGLWNGILDVASAGLMEHYECALHPSDHAHAREHHPHLQISHRALVLDRQRWSSAGPSSSLDLMLALIRRQNGSQVQASVRSILRADVHNDDAVEEALLLDKERRLPKPLRSAIELMRNNLDEPLGRDELSHHVGLSTRALERLFRKHLESSPARHYLELRLARARELLLSDAIGIGEIALACGFVSGAHFSRAFSERYGQSPRDYRRAAQHDD